MKELRKKDRTTLEVPKKRTEARADMVEFTKERWLRSQTENLEVKECQEDRAEAG
jgi:hypothetical protein